MNDGALRGVILVAVAVVIGVILLSQGFDEQNVSVSASDDGGNASDDTTADTGGGGNGDGNTVTPNGEIDPQSVLLVVANGAGVEGAASAVSDQLFNLGYNPGEPVDATNPDPTGLDTVYFLTTTRSFEPEAQQVASDLGLTPDSVLPWPTDSPPAEPGFATVVVVLGANGNLAQAAVAAQAGATTTVPG